MKDVTPSDLVEHRFAPTGIAYPAPNAAIITGNAGAIAFRGRHTLVPPRLTSPLWLPDPDSREQIVRWTAVDGATAYDVQIADTTFDFNYSVPYDNRYFEDPFLETTTSDTSTRVTLAEHQLYVFRVRSRNDSMVSDWSARTYKRTEGTGTSGFDDEQATIAATASLRPNVVGDHATLRLTLARSSAVSLRAVDVAGTVVLAVPAARVDAGEQSLPLDLSPLESGRYNVVLDIDGREVMLPIVVVE